MKKKIKISVIIPTYNRYNYLLTAIESVLKQTYPIDELIIVDDGSTDPTPQMIRNIYGNRIKYIYQKNKGVSAARNKGIQKAKGDYLAFLDSDDWWHPHKIEKQMQSISESNQYQICYTNEIWYKNGKRINQHKHHQKYSGNIFKRALPLCIISPSSIIIEKKIIRDIGLFDENLPVCEDYDYWIRMSSRYPVLFLDEFLINKRGGHEDQLSHSYPIMDYYRIVALDKFLQTKTHEDEQYSSAFQMLEKKSNIILKGAVKHQNFDIINKISRILKKYENDLNFTVTQYNERLKNDVQ